MSIKGFPAVQMKEENTKQIFGGVVKEAKHALRCKGPNDKRLIEILNTNCHAKAATDREQRWMAGRILEINDYKLGA